jgi:polygalacturonase
MIDKINVQQFGADATGVTASTAALQRAIDTAAQGIGGCVFLPAGNYLTGTLWMRSNVALELDAGAVISAQAEVQAFPVCHSAWEGPASPCHASLIVGEGLRNVTLKGRGTIDGRGAFWWDLFHRQELKHTRPHLVRLVDCKEVSIDGLNFINSPRWTINPVACEDVTITGITIQNPDDSPNTDGINPDSCSNVKISDCRIDVGDDCVAIKSGSEEDARPNPRPCQNITVNNCTMLHGHGGVVIGSETSGGIRNISISNCIFSGTERGLRVKSRRGRGGIVEDIRADNIGMDDVLCPIVVNMFYACGASADDEIFSPNALPVTELTPRVSRLRFSKIAVRGAKFAAAYILGLPELPVEDISLVDVSIYMDRGNKTAGAPAMAVGCGEMCRAGFVVQNASRLVMRQVEVHDQLGPAMVAKNIGEIEISDVRARSDDEPETSAKRRRTVEITHPERPRLTHAR